MTHHPVFWLLLTAVAAPLLGEIPLRFKVPVLVLEVLLGIVIGPYVLGLVQFDGFMQTMFKYGMVMTLFMAGMELDFGQIKGRPLVLAASGWCISLLFWITVVGLLHVVTGVNPH